LKIKIADNAKVRIMTEISAAISSILSRLFHSLDRSEYRVLVECFAASGTWERQGKILRGRAAILDSLAARATTLHTIHIVQNFLIDEASDHEAAVRFYLTVYRHDSALPPPYPVPSPAAVGLCKARLEKDGIAWQIKELQTGPYLFVS
jgi:SnoaL-like domain